ncbi:MAG: flagellar assembly protein FliW [Desulfobacterales bacterium]|nr:flagellar assembly protein FliW [Desulfobacterales bacterium]
MVRFETPRFGILEVGEEKIITFPEGLLGFPDIRHYILMDYKDTPLKWLQAVDNPDVAFIVAGSSMLSLDYSRELNAATRQCLQLENDEDLAILVILRVEGEKVIANSQGPILLNASRMRGMQVVLEEIK